MALLILHVCGLFCALDWHSWVVSVLVGLPLCPLELLMLLCSEMAEGQLCQSTVFPSQLSEAMATCHAA